MIASTKITAFEYLIYKLLLWHEEATGQNLHNDISVLKSIKLLFFVSAVGTKKDSTHTLLDDVFNNFVAMPYGHVESDIYSAIKNKQFSFVEVGFRSSKLITGEIPEVSTSIKIMIDESIKKLKEINYKLITMSAFELVELSHLYYSWNFYYSKALKSYSASEQIPVEVIKAEDKTFHLIF